MASNGLEPLSVRVLLAEDSVVNQEVALATLKSFNCFVEVVEDGKAAVLAWQTGGYDIILMDCLMPAMDGYEATREIRRLEAKIEHVPIIALSGSNDSAVRTRARQAGMDDLLAKPFTTEQLHDLVKRWTS